MSHFKALMALSHTHTRANESMLARLIDERRQNEADKRKREERKQREAEKSQREHYFAQLKLEKERIERLEQEKLATMAELARREQEQREALRYGPKRSKSATGASSDSSSHRSSSSNGATHDDSRKRKRTSGDSNNDDGASSALALTREEKRQRKLHAEWHESVSPRKRPSHSRKSAGRLPGGAIDVTETSRNSSARTSDDAQSVKEKLAKMPIILTKLNIVKRDTRTVAEIIQDREKAREDKVLDGDQARGFHDWFGASKKKESPPKSNPASLPVSRTGTPVAGTSSGTFLCCPRP
jgi:protein SPT2